MASKNLMDFEKAIEYMDPMEVTDYLHKTLDFLKRNNNELYFPSISPYVEAFLVNLVSDTRNLMSEFFKHENRKFASEIIEILEMSRDVFRWTHSYENGNLLVYKKIFSNKMKKSKPSSIAHRLCQPQTQQSAQSPTIEEHTPVSIDQLPDIPSTSTSFKLRFISKTLRFIKDETEFTLYYKEMPLDLAEYICSLIKCQDKEVGFGYKSLYAPLWEAMEECSVDYKFEVMLEETSRDTAVLKLEKVPIRYITKEIPSVINNNVNGQNGESGQKEGMSKIKSPKPKRDKQNQSLDQCLNITSQAFPQLELLSNIEERFFADVVVALTDFADDQARASIGFQQLTEEEIAFVKRVKTLAESSKVREMFPPKYRDLLWRLDYSIKEVLQTCKITATVNEKDRSITLKKTPRFPAPQPLAQQSVATGVRSKSLASKTRDRSISKDRIIQFQSGGKLPATGDVEMSTDGPTTENESTTGNEQQERGRSRDGLTKRTAKLLEDLSTPIESDKGIRMMLLMGWNGGALGARGDGIMEPVMPNIEQPTRGGLGHVPPPKSSKASRRPLHFRLTFLHGIYDLLLHDDMQKEIQLKEPLLGKETNFVQSALACLNKRRCPALTEQENALVGLVVRELVAEPGVKLRHEFSSDFKTVILHKLTNQQVKTPKPKTVKKPEVVNITEDDVDVLLTIDDVLSVMPHVDDGQTRSAAAQKAMRRRAVRLLVLTKFAEVLHWDWDGQSRIIFKFTFTLPKKLKLFIRTVIDSLNNDAQHYNLLGWESQVYRDLRKMVVGSMLTWEAITGSTYAFTRTPLINEDILPNAGPHLPNNNNNNDNKTDNRNQIININDCTEQNDNQSINVDNNDHDQRLVEVNTPSNIKDAIDINNEDDPLILNTDDRNIYIQERDHCLSPGGVSITIKNNITKYITVKDVNRINAEFDRLKIVNLNQNERMEVAEEKINTVSDIAVPSVEENHVTIQSEVNNSGVTGEANIEVHNITVLSDWDRDIQDLEETILNVDFDCVVKEEHAEYDLEMANSETDQEKSVVKEENAECYLETAISETVQEKSVVKEESSECDLEITVTETDLDILKKEKDIDNLNAKRSHSSSVCSQELDPKKVKISCETDEHVVRITPKNQEEKVTEELVKQVQSLMANELDKSGGFLPLLKCHGVQNGGLIYSCHDEDDVAWLKKVISVANLDLEIVPCNDLCSEKKTRELLIRINSYIPLDVKKIFRKFEIYNLGLDTKYWRVSHKHTDTTFIMFIVTVDEKSFKYITDEKFSLYCGIDKAQCSIIY